MTINKAYKFRIYPNTKQIELINKTIGCSRFVFNFFLGKQKNKDAYWYICEEMVQNGQLSANNWKGGYLNKYDTIKALPVPRRARNRHGRRRAPSLAARIGVVRAGRRLFR